jgi:hypothetical protein
MFIRVSYLLSSYLFIYSSGRLSIVYIYIYIIIIIIIIGPFWAIAFLRRFCQICLELDRPVFTSLDFGTIIFFTEQGHHLCIQPPNLEDRVSVFMFPSDRVTQLYPQAPCSFSCGGILTRLHKNLIPGLYRNCVQYLQFLFETHSAYLMKRDWQQMCVSTIVYFVLNSAARYRRRKRIGHVVFLWHGLIRKLSVPKHLPIVDVRLLICLIFVKFVGFSYNNMR